MNVKYAIKNLHILQEPSATLAEKVLRAREAGRLHVTPVKLVHYYLNTRYVITSL